MSRGTACQLADAELLTRYAGARSADDFAEIVARHGTMVLRTCLRLTGRLADAEDAAQAAFLVLSQKPTAVHQNLAGWLHKVARDCAQRVVRERVRRCRREEVSAHMKSPASRESLVELREEIDAALVRLPARLREAVVLRYLEGRDHDEAARLAGCNAATMRWRAMKGLEQLRSVLGRRGAIFTMSALTVFLMQEAAATAATAKLVAWASTVTVAGVETGRAGVIAQSILSSMQWAKLKLCATTMAVVTTITGAAALPLVLPEETPPAAAAPAETNPVQLGINGSLGGRRPFPDDSPWNQDISKAPRDPRSDALIASIGRDKPLFPNFGPPPAGISYVVVAGDTPKSAVRFEVSEESDAGPYPFPDPFPLTAAQMGKFDFPLLVLDRDSWKLYETARPQRAGQGWRAYSGAVFDLASNADRPAGWTSTDAAGLPVFPGLVRYDEVGEQQEIRHALRFSCRNLRAAYVPPARHYAAGGLDADLPPLGMRARLRADFDVSSFTPRVQVILRALQRHGMFLAESGRDWYLSGTADARWDDKEMKTLQRVKGQDFEVVQMGPVTTRRSAR